MPHALLQLVPNRVQAALERVSAAVWQRCHALPVRVTRADPRHCTLAEARRRPLVAAKSGQCWGRLYDQRWARIELPAAAAEEGWHLEWQDQGEATAHVRSEPYFGFDVAHRHVPLPAGVREIWLECYCCQSAIWHPAATGLTEHGSRFEGAWLVRRDEAAWAAMHDLGVLFELLLHERTHQHPPQPGTLNPSGWQVAPDRVTPRFRQLLRALDDAINRYDTGGIGALRRALADVYRQVRATKPAVRAVLTGHAHIDLVWLWTEAMGEAKAVHTFATANRLMELYPEFRFAYSQPASYEAVARRAPPLLAAVRRRMGAGTWQATGALQVESDTLLPCGEALARSFVLGQEWFARERGAPAPLVWLPDVFGYAGCLPQLMRLAGAKYFFTTKLAWSAVNRFPYSSFVWRGTDGSEVVAHVAAGVGYNNEARLAQLHAHSLGHAQADVHPEFLHPVGFGDGGGGPTAGMCERARRLHALHDGPAAGWDQPEAFFDRLARRRARLPVWQGECYLEYHRGTYTTHGAVKAAFRALERALQVREAVAVATGRPAELGAVWRRLVFAQFHDYIPGSSVPEVYAEGRAEMEKLAREQLAAAEAALSVRQQRRADGAAWFNPLPVAWRGWVQDRGKDRYLSLPALSGRPVAEAVAPAPPDALADARHLANDRLHVTLRDDGSIAAMAVDGQALELAEGCGLPVLYPDRPANYDAWDIDRQALDLPRSPGKRPRFRVEVERGARAVLALTWAGRRGGELIIRYTLEAGAAVLRMEVETDWREEETLLRLVFPTRYAGQMARFGAPFGSILRGAQSGPLTTEAQWEVPGSRWAAVGHDGEQAGLFVVTEAKYGFSARDGVLAVSLLRSPRLTGFESRGRASPRALCRTPVASPFADLGPVRIRLALGRYNAHGPAAMHPAQLADTLFTAPLVYQGPKVEAPAGYAGLEDGGTLQPAWAVPAAKGWVLRLHEVAGHAGRTRLKLAPGWNATPVDLLGRPVARRLRADGAFAYRPYQILSLLITPA